jgi:hypothetical protein
MKDDDKRKMDEVLQKMVKTPPEPTKESSKKKKDYD